MCFDVVCRSVDMKTGFKTRNILCQPVRKNHGGGGIVAVVEMVNKLDSQVFGPDDEDVLDACVTRIANVLTEKFQILMSAGEKFSGMLQYLISLSFSV